jgi:glc operon protein GlcG
MKTRCYLTSTDAQEMIDACREEAQRNQWPVSIAVVDDGGYLLHLERIDGAGPQTPELATLKASTAALSRFPTKFIEDLIKDRPTLVTFPRRLPVQGGLPITHGGEVVGAIGVSGVKSNEDEQVAQAGLVYFQSRNPG